MIVEVVLLDAGVLALLLIIPLSSRHGVGAGVAKALVWAELDRETKDAAKVQRNRRRNRGKS
ncbi:MAG TPA: hypothetical protein VN837_16690 [Chloroflexota bacterium]|nr:hypothetical protein [Chloroflexota bacterium]